MKRDEAVELERSHMWSDLGHDDRTGIEIPSSRRHRLTAFVVVAVVVLAGLSIAVAGRSAASATTGSSAAIGSDAPRSWTAEEAAAADEEMWDQLASGWVAYGSYDATSHELVRGWIHLEARPEAMDFDLMSSQAASNFGGLPVYDVPDGEQIGVHFSMVGFVRLADVARFDQKAARVAAHGCDPASTDRAEARSCMDRIVADADSEVDAAVASRNG